MREAIKTSDARVFVKSYQPLLDKNAEKKLFRAWWDSNPAAAKAFFDPDNKAVTSFRGGDDETYLTRIILSWTYHSQSYQRTGRIQDVGG